MAEKKANTRPSADATRENILSVAEELFVVKGFNGTSISDIAKQASINQSLIYHHFENKAGLWRQVKLNMFERFYEQHTALVSDLFAETDLKKFIEKFIRIRFKIYSENPHVLRIIGWQQLIDNQHDVSGLKSGMFIRTCEKLAEFKRQGQLSENYEPLEVMLYLCSSSTDLLMNGRWLIEGKAEAEQEAVKQRFLTMVIDVLQKGFQSS